MWSKWIMRAALVTITALAAACGGGGGGGATVNPSVPAGPSSPVGLDRFLLFPNPLVDAAGTYETNTAAYTAAYHAALDPTNAKDTLAKWLKQFSITTSPAFKEMNILRPPSG